MLLCQQLGEDKNSVGPIGSPDCMKMIVSFKDISLSHPLNTVKCFPSGSQLFGCIIKIFDELIMGIVLTINYATYNIFLFLMGNFYPQCLKGPFKHCVIKIFIDKSAMPPETNGVVTYSKV